MNILKTPLKTGRMDLKNRLVMPPMASSKATEEGRVTPQLRDFYAEKSAGGYIGLFILEHSYVSIEGKAGKGQLSVSDNRDIDGLKDLAAIIHENGSKVMAQISHAGGSAKSEITGKRVLGASAVVVPRTGTVPEEMTGQDIRKVIDDFASAAVRVKQAGFDGVEIHSAHGYLLNQFYSPLTNRREDEYNAFTVENRLKLHLEIIEAIRNAVGKDYPVALRLGACDYMQGGTTLQDSVMAAQVLEKAGIDMLDISGGLCGSARPGVKEQGYFSELAEAVKRSVGIPVMLTGGITDAAYAERLLKDNKADLIGVGRAVLKDSLWAKRAILDTDADTE